MKALLWDLWRRSFYLCLYIIPVPLGAYTIHIGSSAMVALITYLILSLSMPLFYLTSPKSGFGKSEKRIFRWAYVLLWFAVQGCTYLVGQHSNLEWLWSLHTIGRDIVFAVIMYSQVSLTLTFSYGLTSLIKEKKSDEE